MADVRAADVAAYILRSGPREALELQKLVYYVQAWSLAWDGSRLFRDRIEAWPKGPVAPELWRKHRNLPLVRQVAGEPDRLSPRDRATIDAVIAFYGGMGSSRLVGMTHEDKPWQDARGELQPGARTSALIPEEAMRRFYSSQAILGAPAPKKPAEAAVEAPLGQTLDVANRLIKDWRSTLDWLAAR